jgi:hypothetical protein
MNDTITLQNTDLHSGITLYNIRAAATSLSVTHTHTHAHTHTHKLIWRKLWNRQIEICQPRTLNNTHVIKHTQSICGCHGWQDIEKYSGGSTEQWRYVHANYRDNVTGEHDAATRPHFVMKSGKANMKIVSNLKAKYDAHCIIITRQS